MESEELEITAMTAQEMHDLNLHILSMGEFTWSSTDRYSDDDICFNLRRISRSLAKEGRISSARCLMNILATLRRKEAVNDRYIEYGS